MISSPVSHPHFKLSEIEILLLEKSCIVTKHGANIRSSRNILFSRKYFSWTDICFVNDSSTSAVQIARFMGPTWGPPGSCRPQVSPMLAPWTLRSGSILSVLAAVGSVWAPVAEILLSTTSILVYAHALFCSITSTINGSTCIYPYSSGLLQLQRNDPKMISMKWIHTLK